MSKMAASEHYSEIDVSSYITENLKRTFEDLICDDYHPDGSRYRRFAQFRLEFDNRVPLLEQLDIRPFSQKSINNNLVGNTLRYFPPIRAVIEPIILKGFQESHISYDEVWQVNCHQVRVLGSPKTPGRAAPEGIHRDGVDNIFMVCADRLNITGGASEVYSDDKDLMFTTELYSGNGLVVNDKAVYHNVTEFNLKNPNELGYRDMFIIAFMPWSEGRYGEKYEEKVTGGTADQGEIQKILDL